MRQLFVAFAAAALLWPAMAGAATPDEMAQQIAGSLRESGELTNYRVGVKFEDGVAWLLGTVTSTEQAETALRLAGNVQGVQHVVNKLEIEAPTATETKKTGTENAGLLLTMMEETASPQPLPPNPTAMAAPIESPAPVARMARRGMPRPIQRGPRQMMPQGVQNASYGAPGMGGGMGMAPQGQSTAGAAGVSYDQANMPGYAWPSYAGGSNYAALTYPKQYSPSAWPYIGPFYPYPQVPLGWRKVTLEWDDGWWNLDFSHHKNH